MYNGWTKNEARIDLPFNIPGYGVISTHQGWQVFLSHYEALTAAFKRTQEALEQATMLDDVDDSYDVRLQEYAIRCLP
jgi:hypothetical protein